jgi:hypothetical protein
MPLTSCSVTVRSTSSNQIMHWITQLRETEENSIWYMCRNNASEATRTSETSATSPTTTRYNNPRTEETRSSQSPHVKREQSRSWANSVRLLYALHWNTCTAKQGGCHQAHHFWDVKPCTIKLTLATSGLSRTRPNYKKKVVPALNELSTMPWRRMWKWMYRSTFSWPRH